MPEEIENKEENKKMKMLGVRLSKDDHATLFEIAEHEDRSVAGVIRMLVKRKIASYRRSN